MSESKQRLEYETPTLVELGSVEDLTRGGATPVMDNTIIGSQ